MNHRTQIKAYAAYQAKQTLEEYQYPYPFCLGDHDVLIEVSHCGICHSDICMIDNEWKSSHYPLVPGHEIIGKVIQTGGSVNYLIGKRVGIGWQAHACYRCNWCNTHIENLCAHNIPTIQGVVDNHDRQGGFASHVVADGRLAFTIPDEIPSEYAAPLLCAGITVFSPLDRYKVGEGMRIGIVGIGGLGHLAIQFAHKMGSQIVAMTHSENKRNDALSLGAQSCIVLSPGIEDLLAGQLDMILITSMHDDQWYRYLKMLTPRGILCFVGVPKEKLSLSIGHLIMGEKIVTGSQIGGSESMRKMFCFAVKHNIKPIIQTYPLTQVNQAIADLKAGKVRYRAVLVN